MENAMIGKKINIGLDKKNEPAKAKKKKKIRKKDR